MCLGCKRQNAKKYRLKDPRAYNFKNRIARYGMSIDEYQTIWDAQDGICPICERDIVLETSRIDHDHKTGAVRGILCVSCNSGIGLLHDSPRALIRAAKYVGGCGG